MAQTNISSTITWNSQSNTIRKTLSASTSSLLQWVSSTKDPQWFLHAETRFPMMTPFNRLSRNSRKARILFSRTKSASWRISPRHRLLDGTYIRAKRMRVCIGIIFCARLVWISRYQRWFISFCEEFSIEISQIISK